MGQRYDQVEYGGWCFHFPLAADTQFERTPLRGHLIANILAAVEAAGGPRAYRRSRHATTYRIALERGSARCGAVFVKVLDAPRGFERWKLAMRGPRGRHVAKIVAELGQAGFVTAPMLTFARETLGGREIIVTAQADGSGLLRILARRDSGTLEHKRAVLRALGAEVAKLHRAGFIHGDLTPFNVFVVAGDPLSFVFIDHERTRRNFMPGAHRRRLRNLVQLGRFELPGLSRTDRARVLHGYAGDQNWTEQRALARRLAAMIRRRILRDGAVARVGFKKNVRAQTGGE